MGLKSEVTDKDFLKFIMCYERYIDHILLWRHFAMNMKAAVKWKNVFFR